MSIILEDNLPIVGANAPTKMGAWVQKCTHGKCTHGKSKCTHAGARVVFAL